MKVKVEYDALPICSVVVETIRMSLDGGTVHVPILEAFVGERAKLTPIDMREGYVVEMLTEGDGADVDGAGWFVATKPGRYRMRIHEGLDLSTGDVELAVLPIEGNSSPRPVVT